MNTSAQPLRILIFALGGEGGGVLMNWIVAAARASGRPVKATSVPGVAQRTGSTSYCIEIAEPGSDAVLSLVPMPGRVDVVLASELVEAARAMEMGFVSDRLTTLIASTGRVYATAEKIEMGDGRFDAGRIEAAAHEMAKVAHLRDLNAIAEDNGTYISATLFGALVGSGVLPWSREISEGVIKSEGRAAASLAGFRAALASVETGGEPKSERATRNIGSETSFLFIPSALHRVVELGCERLTDYQDNAYADLYLDRIRKIAAAGDMDDHRSVAAAEEAARRLALWMAYEDIARVADLKTRPERFDRIRREAGVTQGQVLKVTEFLKPRAEELADILPASLGRALMRRAERGKGLPFLGRGIRLRSNGVVGFLLLRAGASARRFRRKSLRYGREQEAIEAWLDALIPAMPVAPGFAEALAALPRLRKGYSDTLLRGLRAYDRVMAEVVRPALAAGPDETAAARLRGAISAALADDTHGKLEAFLSGSGSAGEAVPDLGKKPEAANA